MGVGAKRPERGAVILAGGEELQVGLLAWRRAGEAGEEPPERARPLMDGQATRRWNGAAAAVGGVALARRG